MSYPILVYVEKSGVGRIDVTVPIDSTVQDAINASGIPVNQSDEIRHNGQVVSTTGAKIKAGDVITIMTRQAGGQKQK